MKILIVDDETRRYGRFISALEKIGVTRNEVELVPSATDARNKMEHQQYDLLILDILLSQWPDSDPDVQHSLNLLVDLQEGDEYHKPDRILGITADPSISSDSAEQFANWTWSVLHYSETDDEWVTKAMNCARYILELNRQSSQARPEYDLDLAIVCALEKPELEQILKLPWNWSSPRPLDDLTFVQDGSFVVEGKTIRVAAAFAPRMGMVSTALLSANVISLLRPRLIAMCGICAGVRNKVGMGDVLLADPAWDFQSGKRVRDQENFQFSIAPHQLPAPPIIRRHLEQIRSDSTAMAQICVGFDGDAPRIPKIHLGPVASGSAVLADGKVIEEIKSQHRELIGVEMEIYGLYAAAQSASRPQPLAFALKSVCDFADPDKDNGVQRFAAYTSAQVLRLLMERFGLRLLDK
jgi:nucleoside phosphorylase/CheY-like chemotaxis protein